MINNKKLFCLLFVFSIFVFSVQANQKNNLLANSWFNKGLQAYNIQTNAGFAVHCFTQALAVTENYVPALLALGDLYAVCGEEVKAKKYFLNAIQNHRDSEYALRRISALYDSKFDYIKEANYLKEILPSITNNYLRLMILNHLGRQMFSLGKIKEGRNYFSQLAPMTNWMIVGGFDNDERTGLRKTFEPEKNLSIDQTYEGKKWQVNWRPAFPLSTYGNINLQVIRPAKWITAYLRTGIISPQSTSAIIHLAFGGAFRVWVNGKPVSENEKYRAYSKFTHRIPIELNSGTNFIVFKLCTKNNDYTFAPFLSTSDNLPLFLETIQPNDETIPLECGSTNKWAKPLQSPGTEFWEKVCKTNQNLYGKVMLGRYYRAIRNYDKGIKLYEQLMKNGEMGAADMYFLGRSYSFKDCDSQAVAAYRSGFILDPFAVAAQTAVAAHYADRNLYDLAQPILEEILSINTNCLYARLELIDLYYDRDWDEDAYRLAKETCNFFPDYAKTHSWLERISRGRAFAEIREKALKDALNCEFDRQNDRFDLANLFLYQRRFDEFFKQIEILEDISPADPDVLWLKLKAYISLRDITNSFKVCNQGLKTFPDHSGFHKKKGDILYMSKERDEAIASYHTSLKYLPNYLWLRQYLDFLEGRDQAFFDKYSWTEKQAKNLVKEHKNTEQVSVEELSKILLRQSLVQVFKDGSSRYLFHYICKVLHPKGVKNNSSIDLPGGSSGRLLRATTYKKDGKVIEATHLDNGQIEFPDVQVGDTIEYKCMWDRYGGSWMDEHFYTTYTFDYSQSEVVREELAIAMPTNREIRLFVRPENINCTTSNFEASFVRHWILTNLPMYRSEPLTPPYYDIARRISLSTITNWIFIADWQRGMVSEIIRGDENVTELAKEITQNATSNLHKIELIFNYITENFRYTQMYENNIAKIKPHPIPDILSNRCGDCKDLSLLMVELLKSLNIPASTALMRSENRGQILKSVPTPDVFNHVIVYIPEIGEKGLFVDPTYRLGEFNLLSPQCQNVEALVIFEDGYELIKTPLAPPSESKTYDYINGQIFSDGSLTGRFIASLYKNDAASFRQSLETMSKIQDIGSYIVGLIDPAASLLSFNIENQKAHKHLPVKIDLTFSAPKFGHENNGSVAFSLPFPFNSQNYLSGLETRQHPIKLSNLGEFYYEHIYKFPDNYEVDIAEKNCLLETKFGTFVFKTVITNSSLQINWNYTLTKQMIEVDEYPDFRDFLNKCSHVTSQVINLRTKE